jgi:hypothetical protein
MQCHNLKKKKKEIDRERVASYQEEEMCYNRKEVDGQKRPCLGSPEVRTRGICCAFVPG